MKSLYSNPELLRYARAQLRPGRLLTTAIICFALSLTIGFAALHGESRSADALGAAGLGLLHTAFLVQALVLAAGGGIACLHSIFGEKEQNTFDYQRITRLTPLELALGKLFGAPLLTYWISLCLAPLTFYAAFVGHAHLPFVFAAYAVLLVASLAFHAFTLLISLFTVKGSQVTGTVLALLLLWLGSVEIFGTAVRMHSLGPFIAADLALENSWENPHTLIKLANGRELREFATPSQFEDVFWGHPVHHFPILLGIDLSLALWFLLAVVRNIKRDPQQYVAYSPWQFLAFVLYLNVILVSFYSAKWGTLYESESFLLFVNLVIFFFLGVALLRNRQRARAMLYASQSRSAFWSGRFWPAPVLVLGTLLAGMLIIVALNYRQVPEKHWNVGFAVLRALAFTVWMVSNMQLLQCLGLRPGKHPLVMGALYLSIYYVCAGVMLGVVGCFREPRLMPFGSLFVPSAIFLLEPSTWMEGPALWMASFVVQAALIVLLFFVQTNVSRRIAIHAQT